MNSHRIVIALAITLCAVTSSAQAPSWEIENAAGVRAYQERKYAEAENVFRDALRQAEKFGESDPRFATAINNLAAVLHAEGNYADAEQLYRRALTLCEKIS